MTRPLVLVRATELYSRVNDYRTPVGRVVEPLVLDGLGFTWTATGERNERGQLLYEAHR